MVRVHVYYLSACMLVLSYDNARQRIASQRVPNRVREHEERQVGMITWVSHVSQVDMGAPKTFSGLYKTPPFRDTSSRHLPMYIKC